ncbi:hypothetical protein V9T40_010547 [Parthenolecanium corni]|uniref:Uncharacterized protein n=1 Tax=Parthenolecanium corni TaxID=536013 RepID=A0AAN9XXA4_9HEMI
MSLDVNVTPGTPKPPILAKNVVAPKSGCHKAKMGATRTSNKEIGDSNVSDWSKRHGTVKIVNFGTVVPPVAVRTNTVNGMCELNEYQRLNAGRGILPCGKKTCV